MKTKRPPSGIRLALCASLSSLTLLAACGGGGESDSAGSTTGSTTTTASAMSGTVAIGSLPSISLTAKAS